MRELARMIEHDSQPTTTIGVTQYLTLQKLEPPGPETIRGRPVPPIQHQMAMPSIPDRDDLGFFPLAGPVPQVTYET